MSDQDDSIYRDMNPEKEIVLLVRSYATFHHTMILVVDQSPRDKQSVLFQRAKNCDWCALERRRGRRSPFHSGICLHHDPTIPPSVQPFGRKKIRISWKEILKVHHDQEDRYHLCSCNCQDYCNAFYNALTGPRISVNEVSGKIDQAGKFAVSTGVVTGTLAGGMLAAGASTAAASALALGPIGVAFALGALYAPIEINHFSERNGVQDIIDAESEKTKADRARDKMWTERRGILGPKEKRESEKKKQTKK